MLEKHPQERSPGGRFLIVIALSALLLRLIFSAVVPPDWEWGDAGNYDSIALNLLAGNGFSLDGIEPTRARTPTYPVFLAAVYGVTGRNLYTVVFLQSLLGALTCILAGRIACRLFGPRAGWIAAAIAAAYPALIYYDTRILREGPTAFLLTLVFWIALKGRSGEWSEKISAIATGAILATVSMCRPETVILYVPAVLMLIGPGLTIRTLAYRGTIVLIPILLVWGPWTARNYATFGTISPVTSGVAIAMWFGSRWAASGADDQTPEARASLKAETHAIYERTEEA